MIVASKVFEADASQTILHMPSPSMRHLHLLFCENPDMEVVLVTDCLEEMYAFDIRQIEKEGTLQLKTHIRGTFCISRTFASSHQSLVANSWSTMLHPFL